MLAPYDISVAFWHALVPHDEPITMYSPRGEEEIGYMWQMKRAMYGTRRASHLYQEHMKEFLGEAGNVALVVCHQVYYCLEADKMAAIHGEDIIEEGEPEELNRLDEILKRLVVVKVLDRIGPGSVEHGQHLNPEHLAAIIRNRSKIDAKPQRSPDSKDLWRRDPEALDELEVEGSSIRKIQASASRVQWAIRHTVLCEKTERDDVETTEHGARLSRYRVGTQTLTLRSDHQEYGGTVRIPVDSDWAGTAERYSIHAGLEIHGEHLVDSWVASDQVRLLSSGEAVPYGIVDGSARGIFTKHMYEEMARTINVDAETDSTGAIGVFSHGRWKDKTHPSSMAVGPRRHS